jgi:3-hydroxybutyrate dehydrogenase
MNGFGDKELIDELVAELGSKYKVKASYSAADMSKPAEIAAMVAQAALELGGVDILVNNAGIQHVAPVDEFPLEKWDAVIAINLSAAFHAIRAALPHMKARNWGRIINIASTHGLVASTQKAAYVAAKHGIVGLTKVVALETATTGVTCNAICPGWVLTPLVQKQIDGRAARDNLSRRGEDEAARARSSPRSSSRRRTRSAPRRSSCAHPPLHRSAASRCRSTEAGPPNEDHPPQGRRGDDPRRCDRDDRRVHGRGTPERLVDELVRQGKRNLTVIANDNALPGIGDRQAHQRRRGEEDDREPHRSQPETQKKMLAGELEVDLVPQGTLIERIRAGGFGLGGVLTPTGVGTVVENGKQRIELAGKPYLLETALRADFALVEAFLADYIGNLYYALTARNFNPVIAMAADTVIVEAENIVPVGVIAPTR